MPATRPLAPDDSPLLARLLRENRALLAPWQPRRSDDYFTERGQREIVQRALEDRERGACASLVILDEGGCIAGAVSLQSIIRGSFQSCSVGYWLAEAAQGRGLATAALREAAELAFQQLRLHRVQAETLPHNVRSQRVLNRLGFVRYGTAERYLRIDGRWQDHALYQLLSPDPELLQAPDQASG